MFARPEKDNRKHIFGLLNVSNGKSIVLEVSVSTSEIKDEWIAALKVSTRDIIDLEKYIHDPRHLQAANVTYSTPKRSTNPKDAMGTPSKADEKFCGTFATKARADDKEQKDCQCTIA